MMVPLRNRRQLFEAYYHRDGSDGVFISGEVEFEVGDSLYVEVNFLEEQRAFRLKGTVRWRRMASGRSSLPPGIGVEFDAGEKPTRDLMLDFARGREIEFTVRDATRLPVSLNISYASDSRFLTDVADDLSAGGAFITTDKVLEKGTELELKLRPPGHLIGLKLKGVVAWTASEGPRQGMGVKFIFDSERKQRQVAQVVENLKNKIIKSMRIQVPR